jgi:hypothetical protein
MVEALTQVSPLAEKRVISYLLKKQMIGRRAYTDSAQTVLFKIKAENRNGSLQQEKGKPSQKYIESIAFEVFAC